MFFSKFIMIFKGQNEEKEDLDKNIKKDTDYFDILSTINKLLTKKNFKLSEKTIKLYTKSIQMIGNSTHNAIVEEVLSMHLEEVMEVAMHSNLSEHDCHELITGKIDKFREFIDTIEKMDENEKNNRSIEDKTYLNERNEKHNSVIDKIIGDIKSNYSIFNDATTAENKNNEAIFETEEGLVTIPKKTSVLDYEYEFPKYKDLLKFMDEGFAEDIKRECISTLRLAERYADIDTTVGKYLIDINELINNYYYNSDGISIQHIRIIIISKFKNLAECIANIQNKQKEENKISNSMIIDTLSYYDIRMLIEKHFNLYDYNKYKKKYCYILDDALKNLDCYVIKHRLNKILLIIKAIEENLSTSGYIKLEMGGESYLYNNKPTLTFTYNLNKIKENFKCLEKELSIIEKSKSKSENKVNDMEDDNEVNKLNLIKLNTDVNQIIEFYQKYMYASAEACYILKSALSIAKNNWGFFLIFKIHVDTIIGYIQSMKTETPSPSIKKLISNEFNKLRDLVIAIK